MRVPEGYQRGKKEENHLWINAFTDVCDYLPDEEVAALNKVLRRYLELRKF